MAYDAATGRELWKVRYRGWSNTIRTVTGHGLAFIGTDYVRPAIWAVRLGGSGDITDTHVAWKREKGEAKHMPATPSPLLVEDLLYTVGDSGTVTCMEAATGKTAWEHKITGGVNASPVLADGRIYVVNRKGVTTVLAHGRTAQVLATNSLGEDLKVKASPAVVDGSIYLRTDKALYRIGKR
jgi:outer membrane protein assembly factor BamB